MAKDDDRTTVRPPPGVPISSNPPQDDPLFLVHLYYPNNAPLAEALASHIRKRAEDTVRINDPTRKNKAFAGRKPETTVYEDLPAFLYFAVHVVIVGIDEFCDLDELFKEIDERYVDGTPVVIHHTGFDEFDPAAYVDFGAIGAFSGYNFSEIDSLLDDAARLKLKPNAQVELKQD